MFTIIFTLISFLTFQPSERQLVYQALSGSAIELIEENITKYENRNRSSLANAYLGALYMRSASFIKAPSEKTAVFRKGKEILEAEITAHPQNAEMRLLRLMIQENCPPFLRYNSHINEDKQFVLSSFHALNEELKQVVRNYASSSEAFKNEVLP